MFAHFDLKTGLPAGLKEKNTKEKHMFEEKTHNFEEKKALFSLLFILESSLIMFIKQHVLYLHAKSIDTQKLSFT